MDRYIIEGGRKLKGTVKISGAKNSALPVMIATLLTDETCVLKNIPELVDTQTTIELLEYLGKKITYKNGTLKIETKSSLKGDIVAPYDLVRRMRASFLVAGPLLARYKSVRISLPGGCTIGVRPVDIHLAGFRSLGANVDIDNGYIKLTTSGLHGNEFFQRYPSVGATENLIMSASISEGKTIIKNSAKEPEVDDLIEFLNKMGARIKRRNRIIEITGVKKLKGANHSIIPDRIEAGTYMIAAAITGSKIKVKHCIPAYLKILIDKLNSSGIKTKISGDTIECESNGSIKPVNITTGPYPKFPTDLQAQWIALMSIADGNSRVKEKVFESRFLHVPEMLRMGAKLKVRKNEVLIRGTKKLKAAPVMVSDLRAGAALVVMALAAEGITEINRIYHLDRGYEKLDEKLRSLGAEIRRVK